MLRECRVTSLLSPVLVTFPVRQALGCPAIMALVTVLTVRVSLLPGWPNIWHGVGTWGSQASGGSVSFRLLPFGCLWSRERRREKCCGVPRERTSSRPGLALGGRCACLLRKALGSIPHTAETGGIGYGCSPRRSGARGQHQLQ